MPAHSAPSLQLHDVALPGVTISGIWPEAHQTPGATLEGLRILERFPFFRCAHILDVPDPKERAAIARWARVNRVALTYCLTFIMYREGLDPSAEDEALRRRAVSRLVEGVREAAECGAVCAQLISGPAPANESDRPAALARLQRSLMEIAGESRKHTAIPLAIEPLDIRFHKRKALGSTSEAVELARAVRREHANFTLCLDTAHMILNEEDPAAMLAPARGCFDELHLCNCITVPGHPFYGDHHVPFGPPGRLDPELGGRVLAAAVRSGFLCREAPGRVTGEIIRREQTPEEVMNHVQDFFVKSWQKAGEEIARSHPSRDDVQDRA